MRALIGLLLLANVAFLAWAQGWLQPWAGLPAQHEREPQRLAAQLNAGAVRLVSAASAAAAASAADCAAQPDGAGAAAGSDACATPR